MKRSAIIKLSISICLLIAFVKIYSETSFSSNKYGLDEVDIYGWNIDLSDKFDDGPYLLLTNDKLMRHEIIAGELYTSVLPLDSIQNQFSRDSTSIYSNVSKIAALSDIHGQYDLFIQLLKSNAIINSNLEWNFGTGHFVITGDIFDRGDKVLDVLWFIFELEQQAKKAGGKVHYLLGNHEYMVLHNDLRYLHKNYPKTSKLLGKTYAELFNENSILGRWLRSKSTVIKINEHIFLHGGLSANYLELNLSLQETNNHFRDAIKLTKKEKRAHPLYSKLFGRDGLIWYRGYFKESFSESQLDSILKRYDAQDIIVGHTSQSEIVKLFNGKIYAVDTSIKKGQYGEILFIENNQFIRGKLNGERINLSID